MTDERAQIWPEPPVRIYPYRYAYCAGCSKVVRDFQRDAVWRDRDGGTLCMSSGSTFHRVSGDSV